MKNIFLILALISSIYASNMKKPILSITASGSVVDLVYKNNKLYTATDAGVVDIFDYKTKKIIKQITVPKIKDFMGDDVDSTIFSVDEFDDNIMILSKSKNGYNRIHIQKNDKKTLIIDYKKSLAIIKAKYLNKNTLILALLSNEIISYDIKKEKENYRVQVSGAKFSDFDLSEDKKTLVVTDESGDVNIFDTKNGKSIKVLSGENLDNVFEIDYKNGVIATAGQDRRVAVYVPKFNSAYHIQAKFIVYSVGLSPSGKIVAYSSDENNNVTLQSTITKSTIGHFTGNDITLSNIVFINENEFLVASNSPTINLYKIRNK